ncbi:MAG: YkgJ family cysteine cluster protein [Bacillota bacterium]
MMIFEDIFREYEKLAAKAETAFDEARKEHPSLVRCRESCSDCCNSVFGLFLVESLYLGRHFSKLDRKIRREAASRAEKADRDLLEMEKRLSAYDVDPKMKAQAMAKERVRCPLLGDDDRCVLYSRRPVTCRAYGIPTVISGNIHSCWMAGFQKDKVFPAFDLDGVYSELYGLSRKVLARSGVRDMERASLLVPVSKSIKTPFEDLIKSIKATEDSDPVKGIKKSPGN